MTIAEEKLQKIASKEPSKWMEKARWRIANEKWLNKSAKIAVAILQTIREKGLTRKDLAEKLKISPQQVNKILKGQENLTLETIANIEVILSINLVEVPSSNITYNPMI
jgi:ribosome-binding protein aMBF1 (putative translation factor)